MYLKYIRMLNFDTLYHPYQWKCHETFSPAPKERMIILQLLQHMCRFFKDLHKVR